MNYVRWIGPVLILIIFLIFMFSNQPVEINGQSMTLYFLNFAIIKSMNPMLAFLLAFLTGGALAALIAFYQHVKQKLQLNSKEKIIKNLKAELNNLRNVSLSPNQQFSNETMVFNKDAAQDSALFNEDDDSKEKDQ